MTVTQARRMVGRAIRRAGAYFIDTVEWTSNGGRRRPKFAERSDIYDPTAGSGPGDELNPGLEAERQGRQED